MIMDRTVTTLIDEGLCNGCGLCVEVCPKETITMKDKKAVVTGEESLNCGHCSAVCPTGAVQVSALDPALSVFKTFQSGESWLPFGEGDITGLVNLTHVRNRGAAFGILSDAELPNQSLLLALVGVAALGAIVAYSAKLPSTSRLPQTALALVMGGAIGNLVDRMSLGYVIDFVDVFWGRHHYPAFNVADSAISVGVTLLVLDMLRSPEPQASVAETPSEGRSD